LDITNRQRFSRKDSIHQTVPELEQINVSNNTEHHLIHLQAIPDGVSVGEAIKFELSSETFVDGTVTSVVGSRTQSFVISGDLAEGKLFEYTQLF
jgi:hypothetical protein